MNILKMIGKEKEEVDMIVSDEEEELEKMTFPAKEEEKSELEKALDIITKEQNEQRNMPSVIGTIENKRGKTLKLVATTNWTGYFFSKPPELLKPGETARFTHNGSRGALIYTLEQCTPFGNAYLLAWSMGFRFGRRVYVKCGQLSKIHCDGWESSALTELESNNENGCDTDEHTLSYVGATNKDATVTFPLGSVSATFGLVTDYEEP